MVRSVYHAACVYDEDDSPAFTPGPPGSVRPGGNPARQPASSFAGHVACPRTVSVARVRWYTALNAFACFYPYTPDTRQNHRLSPVSDAASSRQGQTPSRPIKLDGAKLVPSENG